MFHLSSMTPGTCHGTIKVSEPICGLGQVTDIYGERWDINAIINNRVCACPAADLHPYYRSTSDEWYFDPEGTDSGNSGVVSQTWHSYKVEVVKSIDEENQ